MFKNLRILLLAFVLFNVALGAWLSKARTTDWDKSLNVIVYAINGDDSNASQEYIDKLKAKDDDEIEEFFADIEEFFEREAQRHDLPLSKPVEMVFVDELKVKPPQPPRRGSTLSIMLWSLKLRYWAWRNDEYRYSQDVQIFVLYFDPDERHTIAHSLGLQKGLIGVVNAFASEAMQKENHVIIAHELLHTVGAIDKYDPATNLPLYPAGYADPDQEPLFPQKQAEIMAGRFAISEGEAAQAQRLKQVVIGNATADEIHWQTGN